MYLFLSNILEIIDINCYNYITIIYFKEKNMAQIKLTPEDLRQSATKYTSGSENVTQVLNDLTREQAVIAENWDGSAFDSFEAQKSKNLHNYFKISMLSWLKLLTSLSKLTKILQHRSINFL